MGVVIRGFAVVSKEASGTTDGEFDSTRARL
jgi:hypothetical protein